MINSNTINSNTMPQDIVVEANSSTINYNIVKKTNEDGDISYNYSSVKSPSTDLVILQNILAKLNREVAKDNLKEQLSTLVVTTTAGNTFDATLEARTNILSAIQASVLLGTTTSMWRLADNTTVSVSVDELKEALALAIQEYAMVKGI